MSYEDFRDKIAAVLRKAGRSLTWTEVRTQATLPQTFPNNQWVHRMERDIGLTRRREKDGIIHWELKESLFDATPKASNQIGARTRGKQGAVE